MKPMHSLILIGIYVLYPWTGAVNGHKLDKPHLFGASAELQGSYVNFYCEIPGKPLTFPVHYELYVETNMDNLIGEYTSLSGEIALIPLKIKEDHDGRLICKATGHNDSSIESSFSDGLDFRVIIPVGGVRIIAHPSSLNMWEGQTLTLQCKKTNGTYVSYDWFLNRAVIQMPYDRNNDTLIIHNLSVQHTGDYMCVASNQFNDTLTYNSSSQITTVRVKEYLSKPTLLLEDVKLDKGVHKAVVTCSSNKGTPLNTFTLLNNTDVIGIETSEVTTAIFSVPIELNQDMGRVRCNASNEGNWVMSEPLSLTVETVGGAVTLTPFTHVAPDFQVVGVGLLCKVERGKFPVYRWFLNDSRLMGRGGFYAVAWPDDSFLSLSVGRDSAGFYRCEASDRFNNSRSISSARMLISKEVLNRVSPLVVVVVFSCFAVLIVAVTTCCIYGAVLRRRYSRKYPLIKQRGKVNEDEEQEDEDYLMLEGYDEDVTVADRMTDSSEDEDESVDETRQYEGSSSE